MEIWKKNTDVMSSVHCTRRCWQNLQAKNKVNPYHTRIKQAKYIDDIRARWVSRICQLMKKNRCYLIETNRPLVTSFTFFTIEKKHKAWWIYRQYEKGRPPLIFGAQKVLPLTFFPDITQKKTFVSSLLICFHCSSQSRFVTSRCLIPPLLIWSVQ